MKGKDSKGNLSLALMPLIALMAEGRFLVLSFFTCGQVKGGLNQVVSLRDVNVHAAGGRLSRYSLRGRDLERSVVASCCPF